MAHVFISYSSKHRNLTEKLAAFLENCGLDVWWDKELHARRDFDWQIHDELRKAACVVVIWTEGAVVSEWVIKEATYARECDMLVCAKADDLHSSILPEAFRKRDAHKLDDERDLILRDVLAVREGRLLLEDKREDLPEAIARTPTMLLQAKFGLIPFKGSDTVRSDLLDWAFARGAYASGTKREAGRLIHGPGGLGKTRLLIEIAEALRGQGWSAGFLARPGSGDRPGDTADIRSARRERQAKAIAHLVGGAEDNGLLLVMDYAEGREPEIKSIAAAIRSRPANDARPIRFVLLTRGAGEWWSRLVEDDQVVRALFGGERLDVIALGGINSGKDRLDIFLAAIQAFAPRLSEMGYMMQLDGEPTRQLAGRLEFVETNAGYQSGEGYDRPLAIAMEALLYLAAMTPDANESGVHRLLANILGLERDHWQKLVPLRDENGALVEARMAELERATAQITVVQGIAGRRAAESLFMSDGYFEGQRLNRASVREVADNTFKIYGRGEFLEQLEPDLIGEHHVAMRSDVEMLDGCLAWIAGLDEAVRSTKLQGLLTVLQRATSPSHGAQLKQKSESLLKHIILNHSERVGSELARVANETPGSILNILEKEAARLSDTALEAICRDSPGMRIRFNPAARNMVSTRINSEHDRVGWIQRSLSLSRSGEHEMGLVVASDAVNAYRALFNSCGYDSDNDYRDAIWAKLGEALLGYADALSKCSRQEEALGACEEAVSLFECLAMGSPGWYLGDVARSHAARARHAARMNGGEDAIGLARESVDIARQNLIPLSPTRARALVNLAEVYVNQARLEEARNTLVEAVELFREIVSNRSDQYLREMALSLCMLADLQCHCGQIMESLETSVESNAILLSLVKAIPEDSSIHLELCGAREVYSRCLSMHGRAGDAALVMREALSELVLRVAADQLQVMRSQLVIWSRSYRDYCKAASISPDSEVLKRLDV